MAVNQHANPACGANVTGYVVENATNNGRVTALVGYPRTEGIRATATSTTSVNIRYAAVTGTTAPGDILTISTYVKTSVTRNVQVVCDWLTASGYLSTFDGPSPNITGGAAPTRLTFTTTAAPATCTRWQVTVIMNTPASGNTLEMSCTMVDKSATLIAYADGASAGWVWDGTAFNSASHDTGGGGPTPRGAFFPFLSHHDDQDGPVPGLWTPSRTLWRPRRTDAPAARLALARAA